MAGRLSFTRTSPCSFGCLELVLGFEKFRERWLQWPQSSFLLRNTDMGNAHANRCHSFYRPLFQAHGQHIS